MVAAFLSLSLQSHSLTHSLCLIESIPFFSIFLLFSPSSLVYATLPSVCVCCFMFSCGNIDVIGAKQREIERGPLIARPFFVPFTASYTQMNLVLLLLAWRHCSYKEHTKFISFSWSLLTCYFDSWSTDHPFHQTYPLYSLRRNLPQARGSSDFSSTNVDLQLY